MKTYPVAVVGAGPVGVVMALRLASFGIECLLIEAGDGPGLDLRASTFHPPTLEMLAELGLADPLIGQGLITRDWQIRMHGTGDRVVFDLDVLRDDTPYPYRLQCEQSVLCRLGLAAAEADAGIEVRLETSVTDLTQDADGVTLSTDRGDRLRARYVIGCDGARSVVRHAVGINFEGFTYPETTLLATTRFAFHEHIEGLSNVNYCWSEHGTFSLLRLPDLWRCSLHADEGEEPDLATDPVVIETKLQRIVAKPTPYEVMEVRPYRIHQRIVTDYRCGRVALAGDAAHLNSPSGGMGMNGGIHDAFALCDALVEVLGGADETRLDRYTRQRQTIARDQILEQAHRNRSRMQERDMTKRRAELARLQAIAADPVARRAHLLRSSMIEGLRQAQAIT